jgi:hypothetical protein
MHESIRMLLDAREGGTQDPYWAVPITIASVSGRSSLSRCFFALLLSFLY